MDRRELALANLADCCGIPSDRDEVLIYIETLETILIHLTENEELTSTQKEIQNIIMQKKGVFI